MREEEIIDGISRVEVRTGRERTIKSYVLRSTKLDEEQKKIVLENYEKYAVTFRDEMTEPGSLFAHPSRPVIIEIGFGMGSSTQIIARDHSEYNYLALEVYLVGFVKLLRDVSRLQLDNIKLMRFNAVDVLERMIPDSSIAGFHIFFPDPWPKKRHHKRRLIQPDFVHLLASKLKKGGYIYCVTDWQEYADQMLEVLSGEPLLMNPYEGFCPPVSWRPMTKFEKKGLDKDYKINEVWFERR